MATINSLIEELTRMIPNDPNNSLSNDPQTLKAEMAVIYSDIKKIEQTLKTKRAEMATKTYLNEADIVGDHTAAYDLQTKYGSAKANEQKLSEQLDEKTKEGKSFSEKIDSLKDQIKQLKTSVANRNNRILSAKENGNESACHIHEQAIKRLEDQIAVLNNQLSLLEAQYHTLLGEIEYLANEKAKSTQNCRAYYEEYEALRAKIQDKTAYINYNAKADDEKTINSLEEEIAAKQARISEIEASPTMIVDRINALTTSNAAPEEIYREIERLANLAKMTPYMDLGSDAKSVLEEELTRANAEKASLIEEFGNKDYTTSTYSFASNRLAYLNERLDYYHNTLSYFEDLINSADNDETFRQEDHIERMQETIASLDASCDVYTTTVNELGRDSSPLKRAQYGQALEAKKKEAAKARQVLDSYLADQRTDLALTCAIDNNIAALIRGIIAEIESEMKTLSTYEVTSAKDILRQEQDNLTLAQVNTRIEQIQYAMQFEKMPSVLLEEANQMIFETPTEDLKTEVTLTPVDPTLSIEDYMIDTPMDVASTDLPSVDREIPAIEEATPVMEEISDLPNVDHPEMFFAGFEPTKTPAIEEPEQMNNEVPTSEFQDDVYQALNPETQVEEPLPPFEEQKPEVPSTLLKVVNIEPINAPKEVEVQPEETNHLDALEPEEMISLTEYDGGGLGLAA